MTRKYAVAINSHHSHDGKDEEATSCKTRNAKPGTILISKIALLDSVIGSIIDSIIIIQ